jgi:hypothetical protein
VSDQQHDYREEINMQSTKDKPDGYEAALEAIQDWQELGEVSPEAIEKLQDFVRRCKS